MNRTGYYELEVTRIHKHQVAVGRYNIPYLGEYEQVIPYAEKIQGEMEKAHPGDSIRVKPILVEEIGPRTSDHIGRLLGALNHNALVVDILADKLARHVAKEALVINPDINAMMQEILVEAHRRASDAESSVSVSLPS